MASSPQQLQLFIRLPAVLQKVGMSKSHIYNLMGLGEFPAQIKISQKISVWVASEIDDWIQEKIKQRDEEEAAQ